MGDLVLRTATLADVGAVVAVYMAARRAYHEANGAPPDGFEPAEVLADRGTEGWREAICSDRREVICAVDSGQLLGVLSMGTRCDLAGRRGGQPIGELCQVAVLPWRWNSGIGGRMHNESVAYLRRQAVSSARLEIWKPNARALIVCQRHGWRRTGETRPAADGSVYLRMRLDLP
jgi:hypothetical protein